ncbi:MAG: glycosyltransferase family 2 protein [Chloroflexi bacterium]|nr:glycosyltransferase family 2 protein [Chloroflexota bacterium]MCI0643373.1 glycosyltransferase family 2 protein [Chloroflexota bacterium]MCI0730074.1 glycosyltransferase family 2 protein [Chloroflexota bacterium]
MTDLGIVIVSYNVCDLLHRCLDSVYASQGLFTFTVCVVDNFSADSSVWMVQSEFPQVRLIANSKNLGYPAANNQGLCALGLGVFGEPDMEAPRYCLLLNPDTEVPPDAFERMLAYMDDHPEVGVIGPKLVLPDGRLDLACRRSFPTPTVSFYRMAGLSTLFPRSPRFGRYNMTFLGEDEMAEVDSVVGAFMLVRTAAIQEVGLMDDRFWMYGEDLDWAKRIKDIGWKVMYYPPVSVLHVKGASSSQNPRAQVEFYRAMLIFYYKHYYEETPFFMHWLIILGIGLLGGRAILPDVAAGQTILDGRRR